MDAGERVLCPHLLRHRLRDVTVGHSVSQLDPKRPQQHPLRHVPRREQATRSPSPPPKEFLVQTLDLQQVTTFRIQDTPHHLYLLLLLLRTILVLMDAPDRLRLSVVLRQ